MGEHSAVALHHVIDGPDGAPPVVLLGSLGSTLDMWEPQLAALADDHRVIRVDHRGHGDSPVPPGPYSVAELAGDVLALLDRLALDRVDFVGLSLGGMVGQYLASETPRRIGRLVLAATSAGFPDPSGWAERIDAVAGGGTDAVAAAVARNWFTPEWAAAHPERLTWAEESIRKTPDLGYLGCCQAIRDWDHVNRLGEIVAPTLLIAGSGDRATPPDPHARTLAAGIAGSRLATVQAGHLLTIEQADEANALVTEHLRG